MTPDRQDHDRNCGCLRPRIILHLALLLGAALLLVAFPVTDARADDTEVGGMGGSIQPIESTDIRLEAETVQAVLFRDFAEYRVDFNFENAGEERRVRLGFPFAALRDWSLGDWTGQTSVAGFRAWQDGEPLEVTPQLLHPDSTSEHETQGYFVHEAVFPPGRSTITVSYLAPPLVSAGSRLDPDLNPHPEIHSWTANYTYWLHTGAGWRGTIGKAVVRYRLADTFLGWGADITAEETGGRFEYELTKPPGWEQPDDSTYQWIFTDFEPVDSPYPLRIFPGNTVSAEELAAALRGMDGVQRVEIRSADEVRREHEEMLKSGAWGPNRGPLHDPATRVDAYVDLVGAFGLSEALSPIWKQVRDLFGGLDGDYSVDFEDPYPYDTRLAFFHPTVPYFEVPFGPRTASMALNGQALQWVTSPPPLAVGDRLSFTLEKTPRVREVRVISGDLSRLDGFSREARPKRIRLTFADGSAEFELKDEPGLQRFPVDASGEGPIALEVLTTYPGTDGEKAAIWRVEFGAEAAPEFTPFAELISAQPATEQPATETTIQAEVTTTETSPTTTVVDPEATPAAATGTRSAQLWGVIAAFVVVVAAAAAGFFALRARRR